MSPSRLFEWNGEIFRCEGEEDVEISLVMRLAVMANLFKISAEKLLDCEIGCE